MLNFNPALLLNYFDKRFNVVALNPNQPAQLFTPNPQRVYVAIIPVTNGITLRPTTAPTAANPGWTVATNTPFELKLGEHGLLTMLDWWALSTLAASVQTFEILYQPPGGE